MRSFALWFIPPPDIKKYFQKIISDLSSKYSAPNFEPHITLLSGITGNDNSVIEKAKELVSEIKPFLVTFSEVSFSTTYFQSVFVRVKSSAKLMNANLKAKEIYGVSNNVFMPHLSLLYGDHEMVLREKIVNDLKIPANLSFKADKIIITTSTQDPTEWKHIAEIKIGL